MKICKQLPLQVLLLTVNISSWVLVSARNSIDLLQRSSSRFKEVSLRCLVVGSSLIWKKKKNKPKWSLVVICCHSLYHSLSFLVTRCHSLSFVFTRCTTCCNSLSFVVIRCHSLSLAVPLVCLFINDQKEVWKCIRKMYMFYLAKRYCDLWYKSEDNNLQITSVCSTLYLCNDKYLCNSSWNNLL